MVIITPKKHVYYNKTMANFRKGFLSTVLFDSSSLIHSLYSPCAYPKGISGFLGIIQNNVENPSCMYVF